MPAIYVPSGPTYSQPSGACVRRRGIHNGITPPQGISHGGYLPKLT